MSFAKFFKAIVITLFVALALPFASGAMNHTAIVNIPVRDSLEDANTVARITKRVYEIQNMDKTNLSSAERKALKKELKEMKAQAGELNQRVYLSVGAIIIIILLLILIL